MRPLLALVVGVLIAGSAQVAAIALLKPAMRAPAAEFQKRWVMGVAIRLLSFAVFAAVVIATRQTLPPLWAAGGYLGTMLVLLFWENKFL